VLSLHRAVEESEKEEKGGGKIAPSLLQNVLHLTVTGNKKKGETEAKPPLPLVTA